MFNDSIIVQTNRGNVSYLTIQLLYNLSGEICFIFNDTIIAQPKWGNVSCLTIQLLHNLSGEMFRV